MNLKPITPTQLASVEHDVRTIRHGAKMAEAMRLELCRADPAGFSVKIEVRGHFSSSSTYNQTEAERLNLALGAVVKRRLPELLDDALAVLADEERAAVLALLRTATEVAGGPS